MKKMSNFDLAIGMNDYKVEITTDNNYNVISIIALEDVVEKRKKFKKGEEVKLSKSDIKFVEENLREEFLPFEED